MLKTILTALILSGSLVLLAQKPILDTTALANWPTADDQAISPDGNYVSYTITTPGRPAILYLRSTTGDYVRESGYGRGDFTEDSKRFIYQMPGDSLCIFELESRTAAYRTGVRSYL